MLRPDPYAFPNLPSADLPTSSITDPASPALREFEGKLRRRVPWRPSD